MVPSPVTSRFNSIDAFRAVTMLLMIFVNDLWTLNDIPEWLGHADASEDRLGFSDIIFPAFLFIVGMSVPLAIGGRLKRGDSQWSIQKHILFRGFALILMGILHYNLENYSHEALLPRSIWGILLTVSFFLIWLDYSKVADKTATILKVVGVVLLIALCAVYKGEYESGPWMQIGWWGILGLIGWTYLIVSSVYLWSKGDFKIQWIAFGVFLLLNCLGALHLLDFLYPVTQYVWIVGDGSLPALAMAGVITTLYYKMATPASNKSFWTFAAIATVILIVFGYATRPLWGISKIGSTPSWVTICAGISVATFALLVFVMDVKGKAKWYDYIKPAGVVTLTCYLLPYIHAGLFQLVGVRLPIELRTGAVGLMKSLLFAWLIIAIAGLLKKRGIALKL